MKVSLGQKLRSGPWGGGNALVKALADYLRVKDIEVSFDLQTSDLDIIILFEPNARSKSSAFTHRDILKYLLFKNNRAIVIQQFYTSSQGRGHASDYINRYRLSANKVADHSVFVSHWLHQEYLASGFNSANYSVILHGGDPQLWSPKVAATQRNQKLSLVTHHWSSNPNKGFDIYEKLDQMLATSKEWADQISFTFIGNLPAGLQFKAARYLEPLAGPPLAQEIQKHDIYLTAAKYEAAGMHHIEGALSGLPILYRDHAGMPEYCQGYGVSFTAENFEQKLQQMIDTYDDWQERMQDYPHTAERMTEKYYELFKQLLQQRNDIIKRRQWSRRPLWILQTLLSRPYQKKLKSTQTT